MEHKSSFLVQTVRNIPLVHPARAASLCGQITQVEEKILSPPAPPSRICVVSRYTIQ